MRALRGLGALRDRAGLVAWLDQVATNVFPRLGSGGGKAAAGVHSWADGEGAGLIEGIPDPGMRVDRRVEQAQMSECVRGFVDELPGDYRAVILPHGAHSLSSHEIAEILSVSLIRVHHAAYAEDGTGRSSPSVT